MRCVGEQLGSNPGPWVPSQEFPRRLIRPLNLNCPSSEPAPPGPYWTTLVSRTQRVAAGQRQRLCRARHGWRASAFRCSLDLSLSEGSEGWPPP